MTSKSTWATSEKGKFVRDTSKFRDWILPNADAKFPAAKNRYHLYISLACPWACRCLAAIYMKGLENIIGLSVVHPVFQKTRPNDPNDNRISWAFVDPKKTPSLSGPSGVNNYPSDGAVPDTVNNASYLRDIYEMTPGEHTRYTVPTLWDKETKTIVSNESADILRMLNSSFEDIVPSRLDLYPAELRDEINALNEWVYNDINNGVYKSGFASSQEAYDEAVNGVFRGLDRCEEILSQHRFLVGDQFTEADIRLFVTLVRFDQVYVVHFKCNRKMIKDYPNLSNYLRELYQFEPVKRSVNMDHIKRHYYGSHTHLNPFGIVPVGPSDDLDAPHDRDRFTNATMPVFN